MGRQFKASPPTLLWWVSWPEQFPPFLGQPHLWELLAAMKATEWTGWW